MKFRYVLVVALLLGLLAAAIVAPGIQLAGDPVERLANGDFESGFYPTPAGLVANGWHWFHNGGQAAYGFYDETWTPVVYEGEHGAMIEINTLGMDAADADRYAGIYQTVSVVGGETYELSLHGMLRALAGDPDLTGYNYRLQYGVDYDGGTDWLGVDEWVEVPWDAVYPRLAPGEIDSYTTTLTATGPRLTLFLRGWKKWATTGRELDVNLDGVSLRGAMPPDGDATTVSLIAPAYPVAGSRSTVQVQSASEAGITRLELYAAGELVSSVEMDVGVLSFDRDFGWTPAGAGSHTLRAVASAVDGTTAEDEVTVMVGEAAEFVANGSFEEGFLPITRGAVGNGWGWFINGGSAESGFYDETWAPVVYDGEHSQLIEISTYGLAETRPDRYAGIYQLLEGLTPGATYHLSLHGMLRVVDDDVAADDYRLQWGFRPEYDTDWTKVDNWTVVPWDEVYPRLDPGAMHDYETTFEAPASRVTLFIRAWKKWATVEKELDLNLDAISVTGYRSGE
jgi:hypothetical protein